MRNRRKNKNKNITIKADTVVPENDRLVPSKTRGNSEDTLLSIGHMAVTCAVMSDARRGRDIRYRWLIVRQVDTSSPSLACTYSWILELQISQYI
jgi:hypothetical protein